jgi:hypothetical protein
VEIAGKAAIAGTPTTGETAFPKVGKVEKVVEKAEKADTPEKVVEKAEKAEKVEKVEDQQNRYAFPGANPNGACAAIDAGLSTWKTHLDHLSEAKH